MKDTTKDNLETICNLLNTQATIMRQFGEMLHNKPHVVETFAISAAQNLNHIEASIRSLIKTD